MDPAVVDTIVDTVRVIVNEDAATNIYDFGRYFVGMVAFVVLIIAWLGNPFRKETNS